MKKVPSTFSKYAIYTPYIYAHFCYMHTIFIFFVDICFLFALKIFLDLNIQVNYVLAI
jgi:hypothetical protein